MGSKTMMTVEAFDRLKEEELRFELDEGELIAMTKPRAVHARIERRLVVALQAYLDRNPVGEVFGADILYVLGPRIKRGPDVSVVMRPFDPRQEIQGAPEFAIEILSPSNREVPMRRKIAQYFSAGCKLLWIVDSDEQTVEIWRHSSGAERTLGIADMLEAPELLPGFLMPVSALF